MIPASETGPHFDLSSQPQRCREGPPAFRYRPPSCSLSALSNLTKVKQIRKTYTKNKGKTCISGPALCVTMSVRDYFEKNVDKNSTKQHLLWTLQLFERFMLKFVLHPDSLWNRTSDCLAELLDREIALACDLHAFSQEFFRDLLVDCCVELLWLLTPLHKFNFTPASLCTAGYSAFGTEKE